MKKFTKGMLIAAGIFGAVGIGLTAAGGVMGASMSELTGVKSLKRVLLVADGDYDDDYDYSDEQLAENESLAEEEQADVQAEAFDTEAEENEADAENEAGALDLEETDDTADSGDEQ